MDNISRSIESAPDVPAQVALMVLVSLWGFLSCAAALSFRLIGP
jgi:hypothetical protein